MRVLITGAGGFVGSRLLNRCPRDWSVVALTRQGLGVRPGLEVARWSGPGDLLPAQLQRPFDATIHLAGNSSHALAATDLLADLNATAGTAAAVLGRVQTRRLVLLSSAAVYAGHVGLVGTWTIERPLMAYGVSKLYAEGLARALVADGRIGSFAGIRLYNAFGPGERSSRLIPSVVAAIRDRRAFTLTGDPGSLADPVHVDDLIQCLLGLVESEATQVFDLCGGDARPLVEQVGRIANALGHPAPPIEVLPREGEVPIQFFSDPSPIFRQLGRRPLAFDEAVAAYGREVGWLA